ncbi:MAG: FAD-binding oxidoreductase [Rhodobacteraceae bacterium]|nr:FAD-binding oxidoreductase [Paracoccaceae bacterium]
MIRTAIVIGSGITGVASAEWLRREGVSVTLIDRVAPGAPEQTSYGNAGLLARVAVVPLSEPGMFLKAPLMILDPDSPLFLKWHYLPRLIPWLVPFLRNARRDILESTVQALLALTDDSVDQHLALARGTRAADYIRKGDYFYYYRNRKAYAKDAYASGLRRQAGFVPNEHDRAELLQHDPNVSARYQFATSYADHGWLTSPGRYVAALAEHFQVNGGVFRLAEVAAIGDGEVTLSGGEVLTADRIILCAGAWSGGLSRPLGQKSRLETERGYHLFLNNTSFAPVCPFMVADAKFVVTPMLGGLRCAGIVEFGGLNAAASKAPLDLLRKRIRQVYPSLTWESEETWMGHRPSMPDSLPHLGPLIHAPRVICAYGGQHVGLTIGPRLGRMARDIALGRNINIDIKAYDPNRFS